MIFLENGVSSLVECPELHLFFRVLLRNPEVKTLNTKWLRVKGLNESTTVHSDYYRFEQFTDTLHIAWIPLSIPLYPFSLLVPMTLEHGPLALCKGSHLWDDYDNLMKGTEEIPETFRV